MSYASEVLFDVPVGYWKLNESSGTVAADSSGNGLNGSYVNSPYLGVSGPIIGEPAVSITGGGYVSIPDAALLDVGDVFSTEMWVKRSTTQGTFMYLFSKGINAFGVYLAASTNFIAIQRQNVIDLCFSTVALTNSTIWHHIVVTKNGADIRIYLDAVDVSGSITNSTCTDNATNLFLGIKYDLTFAFRGAMGQAALYPTVLSQSRVTAHFSAGQQPIQYLQPAGKLGTTKI